MKTRWQVIAAVMLICILVFFVTTSALSKFKVEKPLIGVLENHSAILGFEIEENINLIKIYISLNENVGLIQIHKELESTIDSILKQDFIIVYKYEQPQEGSKEWEKYWRVNAIIAQAINTNNYSEAIISLENIIGQNNFYLVIEKNQLFFSYNIGGKNYFSVFSLERGA